MNSIQMVKGEPTEKKYLGRSKRWLSIFSMPYRYVSGCISKHLIIELKILLLAGPNYVSYRWLNRLKASSDFHDLGQPRIIEKDGFTSG